MKEIKEISKDQFIIRKTQVTRSEFEVLKNAESFEDSIKIKRKLGRSYYFKDQLINPYSLQFGYKILITCDSDEIWGAIDRGDVLDVEDTEVELTIFNADFFGTETEINNLLPPDEF